MTDTASAPRVGVVMGSRSDWETMTHAAEVLAELGVAHEVRVVSAHRTPDLLFQYAEEAVGRGIQVIIAGAQLAGRDSFALLKRSQSLEAYVPLVVTASAAEKAVAARVLAEGAFDFIPLPPAATTSKRSTPSFLPYGRVSSGVSSPRKKENSRESVNI